MCDITSLHKLKTYHKKTKNGKICGMPLKKQDKPKIQGNFKRH